MKKIAILFAILLMLFLTSFNHSDQIKKEIPVLCYHNIRAIKPNASEAIKAYTVTPKAFAEQMKALSDNGFKTISPDQLYNYLINNKPLPSKPILITFDDTREEHYNLAATEMNKYGFKGVFFIMTVAVNRPGYMTKEQIKTLSNTGHVIASHTWDHHPVTKYTKKDWDIQLIKPQKKLEAITGKPVQYFAYPFGSWNSAAIAELKKQNYKLAFILSTKKDSLEPQFTVRRMIVPSSWSSQTLLKAIKSTFNK